MDKKLIIPALLVNLILSVSLTFTSSLYSIFQLADTAKLEDFFISGKPFLIDYVASSQVLKYAPLLPVLMAWFFIGALAYFVFYALIGVYSFAYNALRMSGYTKSEVKEDFHFNLKPLERVAVHLVAVCTFAFSLTVLFIVLLPFSDSVYVFTNTTIAKYSLPGVLSIALPLFALCVYWIALVSATQIIWYFVKRLENYEAFKAERESC